MKWLNSWFSFSWKKLVLVTALIPLMWFVHDIEFGRVEAFIRDSFQYLNTNAKVEKSLVTVNINGKENNFERPFNFLQIKNLIDKILANKPKNLIIAFSKSDFNYNDNDIRLESFNYLKNHANVYFFATSSVPSEDINDDPILRDFPRQVQLTLAMDKQQGPRDFKRRRSIISYDMLGQAGEFLQVEKLGFNTKSAKDFPHTWNWWGSRQAYFKAYPEGTFGSFDAGWVIQQNDEDLQLEGKTVILGTNDEYSFLFSHSVFDLVGKIGSADYKAYPIADSIANTLNLYISGDYMKLLNNFNDLIVVFIILFILVFLKINIRKKIIIFGSLIPLLFLLTAVFYMITDFYINTSRSLTLLFFLQYVAIPFIGFNIFKVQEKKKFHEINDARIDALLSVSEKVAHDIRSPLSAINLVADRAIFPDQEYKEIFDSAIKRIDETATKILTKYRTKTGRETEQKELLDLAEIINEIVKEKKILSSSIDFKVVIESDVARAIGIKLDLERIVSNILDNSVFALKSIIKPKIFISVQNFEKMVQICFTDNGTGIKDEVLRIIGNERITTKSHRNQGNGIGLLHAKRVIESLDGKFEIDSKENIGTTIKISLPKA